MYIYTSVPTASNEKLLSHLVLYKPYFFLLLSLSKSMHVKVKTDFKMIKSRQYKWMYRLVQNLLGQISLLNLIGQLDRKASEMALLFHLYWKWCFTFSLKSNPMESSPYTRITMSGDPVNQLTAFFSIGQMNPPTLKGLSSPKTLKWRHLCQGFAIKSKLWVLLFSFNILFVLSSC